jgi:hypothetical protein
MCTDVSKKTYYLHSQGKHGRNKRRACRSAAEGANLHGTLRNYRKYFASKLSFPPAKEFFRKLSAFWARAFKNFRQPCPRPKKFQEYHFEGAPNY